MLSRQRVIAAILVLAVIAALGADAFALQASVDISFSGMINYPTGMLKLHVDGTVIKDTAGRKVRLAGFSGHPWHHYDSRFTLTESDIQWISSQGFNVLRAVIYWEQFEPKEGQIDESFFTNYLDKTINWCEQYGVYVILDMHQWGYSAQFGGHGFPTWCCDTYSSLDDFALDFWRNQGQASYARQKYVEMWRYLANRYKDRGGVIAGYELFNEPYTYPSKVQTQDEIGPEVMEFFDKELAPAIRVVDPDTIIFYDAFIGYENGYTERFNEKPTLPNIAWARSFYDLASSYHQYGRDSQYPNLQASIERQYQKYIVAFGCPLFLSEIGWNQRDDITTQWLTDVFNPWEEKVKEEPYSFHFAWWRYSTVDEGFSIRPGGTAREPELSILKEHILPTFS